MRIRKRKLLVSVFAGSALGLASMGGPARAEVTSSVRSASAERTAGRWQASFDAFAQADRESAPRSGGVLFVGSSSIRLWDGLAQAFASEPTIVQRGFGGSRLVDCANFVDRLVLPYRPRLIVVYAGDNDLAEGATPTEVLASYRAFVDNVRAVLPQTRIAYLSIKPSPARVALLNQAREANRLIAEYAKQERNLDYIDIYSAMLDAQGQPRRDLFSADSLHLNAQGYKLWASLIAAHLGSVPSRQTVAAAS